MDDGPQAVQQQVAELTLRRVENPGPRDHDGRRRRHRLYSQVNSRFSYGIYVLLLRKKPSFFHCFLSPLWHSEGMKHNPIICAVDTTDVFTAQALSENLTGSVGALKLGL